MKTLNKTLIALSLIAELSTATYATCATHVDMGNHRIVNTADPINSGDVVNKKYLEAYMYETMKTRFIRDASKEVVLDVTTNLIWQDDSAISSFLQKPWLTTTNYNLCIGANSNACYDTTGDTASTYCETLSLGGYTDWRLPTIEEISGIHDSTPDPGISWAISSVFQNNSNIFWSSTPDTNNQSRAWEVDFGTISVSLPASQDPKNFNYSVRCVRNGQ